MTLTSPDPEAASIGGYRLVRTLGAGPRATVHLGHAAGHPQTAVKVFAAAVPGERIEREAEALMRAAGDHVVRLDDLALDDRGRPAFLLERIAGPTLAVLLERRGAIRPGEAVTILAPIAGTLGRMHRAGVVHGGLDPASVLFTESGSPTLVGFGDAQPLDLTATGRARVAERNELLARDVAALRRVLDTVLERTALQSSAEVAAAHALRELPEGPSYADQVAESVFDLAEPEPLDLDAASAAALPGRLTALPGLGPKPPGESDPEDRGAPPLLLGALQVPDWLHRSLAGGLGPKAARLKSALGTVRRPFWVAGGAAAAALLAAVLLTPENPVATAGRTPEPSSIAATTRTAEPDAGTTPTPVATDPARAARELLDLRAECFRELSVLCLDAVDQPDSSAWASDSAAILAAQEQGGIDADGVVIDGEAELVERLGDTALIRIGAPDAEPASVLLIRTEAGWRIRGFPGAARG